MMKDFVVGGSLPQLPIHPRYSSLPPLPGVDTLSLHEIHSDLCELQRSLSPDDTDGDSSVESDDVVDSHYPVKPRRSIRIVDRDDIGEFDKLDNISFEIEEALKLIKQLFISNSLLFEAENRREDLEIMSQGFANRLLTDKLTWQDCVNGQEHYLRLLQGLLLRSLNTYRSHLQQNSIFQRIYDSLLSYRDQEVSLTSIAATSSSAHSTSTKPRSKAAQKNFTYQAADHTIVRLEWSGGIEVVVIGESIWTPFGQGQVVDFQASSAMFSVKLAYAIMHSASTTILQWIGVNSAQKSMHGINNSFHSEIRPRAVTLSPSLSTLPSILSPVGNSVAAISDGTDQDEMSQDSNPPSSQDHEVRRVTENVTGDHPTLPLSSLVPCQPAVQRSHLKNTIKATYQGSSMDYDHIGRLLPVSFVVTQNQESLVQLTNTVSKSTLWDLQALGNDCTESDESERDLSFVSGQGHCWNSDVGDLRDQLGDMQNQLESLRKVRDATLTQLKRSRAETSQLSSSSAALRLKMFTRRHSHRTLLSNFNLALPTNVVAPSQSVVAQQNAAVAASLRTLAAVAATDIQGPRPRAKHRSRSGSIGGDDSENGADDEQLQMLEGQGSRKRGRENTNQDVQGVVSSNKKR